ncbi:NAD(P) transhydrogenase subunit alpha [Kamptonema cortianum]|nr:NAD(P) transhydrogenase subunit alpha [Oscillatoria laete-virens]MDK3159550.1 NAD(P) transhydrogenase subunit alpha [Kamptonema cortianum]MDL5053311.1 NAD(P) transhydrogenase subunit alpha [Oscillatoria laete-virens NRMC-F 0139]
MLIVIPKEMNPNEKRVPVIPDTVAKFIKLGAQVHVESGLGAGLCLTDEDYRAKGAQVIDAIDGSLACADIVLRLGKPTPASVAKLRKGCIHISYLDPFHERELVCAFRDAGVSAISMEMIPRTTIAQKMDALSSQANLAGYEAVLRAAVRLPKIFPMMTTAAGTISPARVFVIGAGVAGLQAIATAKRLGARVEAFDTRPVVEEQVKSLGAKFVKVDLGETGQTAQGYAKELTPEQIEKQRQAMAKCCAQADVVITTAQVFGRKAPRIITADMIKGMQPGSVIVDMAVESGGNVEGSRLDEEVVADGVVIMGIGNLAGEKSVHASQVYSANLYHLIEHSWDREKAVLPMNLAHNDILRGCVITHGGQIVNETINKAWNA